MENRYQEELSALGRKIKQVRLSKGMTQMDLEVASGITEADISRIENGKQNIEFFTLVKLAQSLEIGIKDLFEPE
jgi:HTH-type transcriptional regulator, competence development regulator